MSDRPRFHLPDHDDDFPADQVELFFDLAFVIASAQLVSRLLDDPGGEGVARAGLLFLLLWLPWTQVTWAANAVSCRSRASRVLLLGATVASVPMAASVTTAFGDGGPGFAISLSVIVLTGLGMLGVAYEAGSEERRATLRFAVPNVIAIAVLVTGAFLDEGTRTAAWIIALGVVAIATVRAGGDRWLVRPGHMAERHGLIIIVALGEVIVAIALPVLDGLEEGAGVPGRTVASLVAAGAFAALLWWGYFDRPQPSFEHRADQLDGIELSRFARDTYTYLHAPIVAGVISAAAALEEITVHPDDALPVEFRWMLFGGLALYVLGIEGAVARSFGRVPPERPLALAAIALVLLVGADLSGLQLLLAVDVILVVALTIEYVRVERRPAAA